MPTPGAACLHLSFYGRKIHCCSVNHCVLDFSYLYLDSFLTDLSSKHQTAAISRDLGNRKGHRLELLKLECRFCRSGGWVTKDSLNPHSFITKCRTWQKRPFRTGQGYIQCYHRLLWNCTQIYELSEPMTPAGFVRIKIIISYKVVSGIPVI